MGNIKKTKIIYDDCGDELSNIVIDNGSSVCRAGFAGDDAPRVIFPSRVARYKNESVMVGLNERDTFIGDEVQNQRELLSINYPMERGIVTNWDDMEKIWQHAFTKLDVPPEEYPVLVSEPALNPMGCREKMTQVMFETFNAPAFHPATQAILSMYASGRGSAVVCETGDGTTHIVPVYEGYKIQEAVQRLEVSGRDITHFLSKLLQERGYSFSTTADMEIVRDIKEKLGYVAQDFEEEMKRTDLEKVYELPDGKSFTLESERFKCAEAMFQPSLLGSEKSPGIHQHVFNTIMRCDVDTRPDICCNIVVSGGNTLFPGFPQRLKKEVAALIPGMRKVNIVAAPERLYNTWIGGSILMSLSTAQALWITKAEYEECGPQILYQKFCT